MNLPNKIYAVVSIENGMYRDQLDLWYFYDAVEAQQRVDRVTLRDEINKEIGLTQSTITYFIEERDIK